MNSFSLSVHLFKSKKKQKTKQTFLIDSSKIRFRSAVICLWIMKQRHCSKLSVAVPISNINIH